MDCTKKRLVKFHRTDIDKYQVITNPNPFLNVKLLVKRIFYNDYNMSIMSSVSKSTEFTVDHENNDIFYRLTKTLFLRFLG